MTELAERLARVYGKGQEVVTPRRIELQIRREGTFEDLVDLYMPSEEDLMVKREIIRGDKYVRTRE